MKRIIIIGSLVSCALLALTGEVQAQSGIEQVLKNIEANNKELQANAQLITSQKLEAKTDNNLPDPTLSYAHLWGAKDKNETIGELVVSQSFDFPSLYATRNKLNRLKAGAFDSQADVFRQEKLLLAKEVCLDIIMLRQQKHILEERLRNAEELAKMYARLSRIRCWSERGSSSVGRGSSRYIFRLSPFIVFQLLIFYSFFNL